ncbi:MAG TPA: mycofactocin biosynthesis glycosyltransferase MftF [Mycobacteriales bacterium]
MLRPTRGLIVGDTTLLGGTPRRLLRLTREGAAVARSLLAGEPAMSEAARALGRRLLDAGHARSYPPGGERPSVTVVVPVRDRDLTACLDALGDRDPVIVVDDGSVVPVRIDRPWVTVLRHDVSRGPAAARNTGLDLATTEIVACVDSDVVVSPGWLDPLLTHFADPAVAAAAPRVRPLVDPAGPSTALNRYLAARSPLDLGADDVPVRPGSPVAYVPSAALVLRRTAGRFDETLRVGEDVDLVWRLVAAGHTVRYEPAVAVAHREPSTWGKALHRRHVYGRSAGPLAARHPESLTHLRAGPLPLATATATMFAPPVAAVAIAVVATAGTAQRLHRAGVGGRAAALLAAGATGHTVLALGRWLTLAGGPVALVAAVRRPRLAVGLVAPLLYDRWRRQAELDPVRFVAAALGDDLAYASGVWRGVLRSRDVRPIVPRWR